MGNLSVTTILVAVAVLVVPSLVAWPLVRRTLRRADPGDRSGDNVSTASLRFVGACFAFVSSFLIVALWNADNAKQLEVSAHTSAVEAIVRDAITAPPADFAAIKSDVQRFVAAQQLLLGGSSAATVAEADTDMRSLRVLAEQLSGSTDTTRQRVGSQLLTDVITADKAGQAAGTDSWNSDSWIVAGTVVLLGIGVTTLGALYPPAPDRSAKWRQAGAVSLAVGVVWAAVVLLGSPQTDRQDYQRHWQQVSEDVDALQQWTSADKSQRS